MNKLSNGGPVGSKKISKKKKVLLKKKKKVTVKKAAKPRVANNNMDELNSVLSQAYVRQLLIDVGGENTLHIVRNFSQTFSDEELAKKLKLKISDVRATLNKLHNEGIVNYYRKRDGESGWYSYSWSLNMERMKNWIEMHVEKKKLNLNSNGDNYYCPRCGAESISSFESAVEQNFKCRFCSRPLEFIDEERASELLNKEENKIVSKIVRNGRKEI